MGQVHWEPLNKYDTSFGIVHPWATEGGSLTRLFAEDLRHDIS